MKTIVMIILLLGIFFSAMSQTNLNREKMGEKDGQTISFMYGDCTREGLEKSELCTWFSPEYQNYTVKKELFNESYSVKFDSIQIFMGTWCEDSQREVPRICKIFDEDYLNEVMVHFVCLDTEKKVDVVNVEDLYIEYVPTIIFYKKGEELCRIIEQPRTSSLEEDIMDLLGRIQE